MPATCTNQLQLPPEQPVIVADSTSRPAPCITNCQLQLYSPRSVPSANTAIPTTLLEQQVAVADRTSRPGLHQALPTANPNSTILEVCLQPTQPSPQPYCVLHHNNSHLHHTSSKTWMCPAELAATTVPCLRFQATDDTNRSLLPPAAAPSARSASAFRSL